MDKENVQTNYNNEYDSDITVNVSGYQPKLNADAFYDSDTDKNIVQEESSDEEQVKQLNYDSEDSDKKIDVKRYKRIRSK